MVVLRMLCIHDPCTANVDCVGADVPVLPKPDAAGELEAAQPPTSTPSTPAVVVSSLPSSCAIDPETTAALVEHASQLAEHRVHTEALGQSLFLRTHCGSLRCFALCIVLCHVTEFSLSW
jgi:hypothetical protein